MIFPVKVGTSCQRPEFRELIEYKHTGNVTVHSGQQHHTVTIIVMAKELRIFFSCFFTLLFSAPGLHAVPVQPVPSHDASAGAAVGASPSIRVAGFRFTGNTLLDERELDRLLAAYIGRTCSIDDLRQAAATVTKAYHDRGYLLARAYLPVQRIEGGVVELSVLEGKVARIVVQGNRNYSETFIREYILGGRDVSSLSVARVERALLLLNSRFADLKATANFQPGIEPGTADLYVKVEDGSPVHGAFSVNNYGSKFVSRYRFGTELQWINPVVQGSLLSVGAMVGDRIDHMSVFNTAYTTPLNSRGTMASVRFSDGSFDVGKDFADLGIHNNETTLDLSVSHPLLRSRTSGLVASLGFRSSDARFYQLDEVSSKDNIRAVYATLQGDMVHNGGKSFASLTASRGLGELLDGTEKGDPFASRAGASNDFWRLNGTLARVQQVSGRVSALFRFDGQLASDGLLAGEEWLAGGVNSVHGYAPGEESGQQGYSMSLSLRASPLRQQELLQLAAFLDHGYVRRKYADGTTENRTLTGAGFGLYSKFDLYVPAELRFDVGWPIDPSDNSLGESPVLYMETALRF